MSEEDDKEKEGSPQLSPLADDGSPQTKAHKLVYQEALKTLEGCTPGLAQQIRCAIAISIALRLRDKVTVK